MRYAALPFALAFLACAAESPSSPAHLVPIGDGAADGFGPFQGRLDGCEDALTAALTETSANHFWSFETDGCDAIEFEVEADEDVALMLYVRDESDWTLLDNGGECGDGAGIVCLSSGLSEGEYLVGVTTREFADTQVPLAANYSLRLGCFDALCEAPTCVDNDGCGPGEYCRFEEASCGDEGARGMCAPRPDGCVTLVSPTCGCDGTTYGNACAAALNGVSVQHVGECRLVADEGERCGGTDRTTCRDGLICDVSEETCSPLADGVCREAAPSSCPEVDEPVCGCDGVTYENDCERAAAGTGAATSGACAAEGTACGGFSGVRCASGLRCDVSANVFCSDTMGVCAPEPACSTEETENDPVCGCDRNTYQSECERIQANVGRFHAGGC